MPQYSPFIKVMTDAATKAGRGLVRDFGEVENLQVSQKGPNDFVSAADHRAEETIIYELQKARPDYNILSEETGEIKGGDEEHRWIIDPLDGTMNFLHGLPMFCVSIALEKKKPNGKGEIIAAVTFAPVSQEIYWAEKGQGAFINDRRLRTSGRKRLDEAMLGTGGLGHGRGGNEQTKAAIRALAEKDVNVRIIGSAALELAFVAAGKLDGFWHADLSPWDTAAGILLISEAQGMVTQFGGASVAADSDTILGTNSILHEQLDSIIAPCYKNH